MPYKASNFHYFSKIDIESEITYISIPFQGPATQEEEGKQAGAILLPLSYRAPLEKGSVDEDKARKMIECEITYISIPFQEQITLKTPTINMTQ